jgi:hypothetical protein
MQCAAADILLHRPLAQLGNAAAFIAGNVPRICVERAFPAIRHDHYANDITLVGVIIQASHK